MYTYSLCLREIAYRLFVDQQRVRSVYVPSSKSNLKTHPATRWLIVAKTNNTCVLSLTVFTIRGATVASPRTVARLIFEIFIRFFFSSQRPVELTETSAVLTPSARLALRQLPLVLLIPYGGSFLDLKGDARTVGRLVLAPWTKMSEWFCHLPCAYKQVSLCL